MRSGRRRIAYHSEDEYRLQERKPMFKSGDPYRRHMEWRDEETAFLGTRRLMALEVGDTLPLEIRADTLVAVRCGEVTLTEGRMGRVGCRRLLPGHQLGSCVVQVSRVPKDPSSAYRSH